VSDAKEKKGMKRDDVLSLCLIDHPEMTGHEKKEKKRKGTGTSETCLDWAYSLPLPRLNIPPSNSKTIGEKEKEREGKEAGKHGFVE